VREVGELRQKRNAALNLVLRQKSKNPNHGQPPIIQLRNKAVGLLLRRTLGRKRKRVVEVEGNRVGDLVGVVRELHLCQNSIIVLIFW